MDTNIPPEGQIDGHRVVFYRGIGWRCDCETFQLRGECAHTIKASALLTWGRPPPSGNEDPPEH